MLRRQQTGGGVMGLSPTRDNNIGHSTLVRRQSSVTSDSDNMSGDIVTSDSDSRVGKLDTLHSIRWVSALWGFAPYSFTLLHFRYKLEHNQISRSEVDKAEIFDILNLHLEDPDQEIQHTALQLIQVRLVVVCLKFHCVRGFCFCLGYFNPLALYVFSSEIAWHTVLILI